MLILFIASPPPTQPLSVDASTYDVFSCAQPDYTPAPTDGWISSSNNVDMRVEDNCAQGGYLTAAMLGWVEVPAGAESGWTFFSPEGTSIKRAILHWDYSNGDTQDTGQATAFESLVAPYRYSRPFATCVHSAPCCCSSVYEGRISSRNLVTVPAQDLEPERGGPPASISMVAGCMSQGSGADHCYGAVIKFATFSGISAATITLEDANPPQATAVGGSLMTRTEMSGPQTLAINARDVGSGIYQAILQVDGKEVQSTPIDNNSGHCQNVGQTNDGRPAFLYIVPCKLEINNQYVSFNLFGIPDGPHRLTVLVTDAAGNATVVLDRDVIIGRGVCNGTCNDQAKIVASYAKLLKGVIKRRYVRSALKLQGRLLEPSGGPVSGARLDLLQQATYVGAPEQIIASTTTNVAGQWAFAVSRGPSRALRVAFRSHALDGSYAAQLQYNERVFADVDLKAPRHVRASVPFVFHGKLVGGYVPPEGSIVQMEIFYSGRWRTIEAVRSTRKGTFEYGYTFATGIKGSYRFRASIRYSRTYPFLAAASRPVRVRVR
jgi:hypothetical protein